MHIGLLFRLSLNKEAPMPDRRRVIIILLAAIIIAAIAAAGRADRALSAGSGLTAASSARRDDAAEPASPGALIFKENCAGCHGPDASGTEIGPTLKAVNDSSLVERVVRSGKGPMPSFAARLSGAEIGAVAEYIASTSTISLAGGTLSRGGSLYRLDCAGCHGATGRGGALVSVGLNAPALTGFSPAEVATAIIFGPGPMPSFSKAIVDQHDLASLVDFVETLKEPDHPGGQPLGYRGPVTEALAGAGALAVLLLVTVWIERRGRG